MAGHFQYKKIRGTQAADSFVLILTKGELSPVFGLEFAAPDFLDHVFDLAVLEEHLIDSFDNRHFDAELLGKRACTAASRHAFGNHLHAGEHLVERFALADVFAHVAVAAMLREARHNEVAHAGKAGKRFGLCTESLAQAAH